MKKTTTPKKQTKDSKEAVEVLTSIYANKDGSLPDLTHLDIKKHHLIRRLLGWLLFLVIILGGIGGGFWWTWNNLLFQSQAVIKAEIKGPSSAHTGENTSYTIYYENSGKAPIASADLTLHLPPDFVLIDANPTTLEKNHWTLGSILPGERQNLTIIGKFRSEVPSNETIQALFSYTPANISSPFQKIISHETQIDDSSLQLTIDGPEKALAGDEVTYTVKLVANKEVVERVLTRVHIPEGLQILSTEPAFNKEISTDWLLEKVDDNIFVGTIKGQYASDVVGLNGISVDAFLLDNEEEKLQRTTITQTDVIGGALHFSLIGNGGKDSIILQQNNRLFLSIPFENTGLENIEGVAFSLDFTSNNQTTEIPIDWDKVNLTEGSHEGQMLIWSPKTMPVLTILPPSFVGTIDVSLPLSILHDINQLSDDFNITLNGSFERIGSIQSPRNILAKPIRIQITSDMKANIEARYFAEEGQPIGEGPFPPEVNKTTTYQLIWQLSNNTHALSEIVFSTNLPPGIIWNGQSETTIGTISFNDQTRILNWKIDRLPVNINDIEAKIPLSISPNESDVGAYIKLTNATSIQAKDTVTNSTIRQALDIITTELTGDTEAKGKGVVINP